MPHVVVEYSSNIKGEADIPGLLKRIAKTIFETGEGAFPPAALRVRAIEYTDYVIGDDQPEYAFVQINVRVAQGRPAEVKKKTFDAVFAAVKDHLKPVDASHVLALAMDVEEFGERLAYKQNRLHEKFGTKPFAQAAS